MNRLLRHLVRQKLSSVIHIVGLTLGLCTCLLIGLWISYQMSFDSYHNDVDRIYRVISSWNEKGTVRYHPHTSPELAVALRKEGSGLDHISLVHPRWNSKIAVNQHKKFIEKTILIVDPDFLNIFTIVEVSGNAREALKIPYHAVLTESTAKKFFGREDPIGKTFIFREVYEITVGAVIGDVPANTNYPYSMLLSYVKEPAFLNNGGDGDPSVTWAGPGEWRALTTTTLIKVSDEFNELRFNALLGRFADKYVNADSAATAFMKGSLALQPVNDIHLNKDLTFGAAGVSAMDTSWLRFFGWIGAAVLLLACANFINLSAAHALSRASEVGIRKVVGATKIQLMLQFLSEAWILALFSGVLAVMAAWIALPWMNNLLQTSIVFDPFHSPLLIAILFTGTILTGLVAGIYPAWIITRFNPLLSLKGRLTMEGGQGSLLVRKFLLVIQFTISSALVLSVLLFARQTRYVAEKDLGFNKEHVITVPAAGSDEVKGKSHVFANAVMAIPGVKDIAFSDKIPGLIKEDSRMNVVGADDPHKFRVGIVNASPEYYTLYGLKLLAGRLPSETDFILFKDLKPEISIPDFPVVVNRQLLKELELGTPQEAIGKPFGWSGGPPVRIIGVVEDFNSGSLYNKIGPLFFTCLPSGFNVASIRIEEGADLPATIDAMEAAWNITFPNESKIFEFHFLDDQLDEIYKSNERLHILFQIFAGLAIVISCFGLWGLLAYSCQQRTKEIGIRKVLGASIRAILMLLTREFVVIILLALCIAFPTAYYFLNSWLQTFAFHVTIGWEIFATAGGVLLLLAMVTMIVQTLKAALANPVRALRNE
ncbi:MAG: FtsX-like permease family protein [Bacteroidota bacterium]